MHRRSDRLTLLWCGRLGLRSDLFFDCLLTLFSRLGQLARSQNIGLILLLLEFLSRFRIISIFLLHVSRQTVKYHPNEWFALHRDSRYKAAEFPLF